MQLAKRAERLVWSVPVGLQLSVIYAVLLALVLSVLGLVLYSQLNSFLIQNTADRLSRQAGASLSQPAPFGRGGAGNGGQHTGSVAPAPPNNRRTSTQPDQFPAFIVRNLSAPDVAVAVLDSSGAMITSTVSLLDNSVAYIAPLPTGWQSDLGAGGHAQWVVSEGGHTRQLLLVTSILRPDPESGTTTQLYLVQSASLEAANDVLNQLRLYLGLGIILGTLIGVVAGLALTRVVLRPLDRISRTATAIASGDLDRRLHLPNGRNEVARLGHAFDGMVDRLASALDAQRRFVADASHELRTPLTSLVGLSELLMIGADQGDTKVVQRTVRSMHNELGRLSRLVTDLLTLSRLDSTDTTPSIKYVPIDACSLLLELAEQVAPLAEAREVRLTVGCSGRIMFKGEPDKLKQVLLNLVDNALRYTPAGGEVRLEAWLEAHHRQVRFSVRDNGSGIAPEDLPHVFDRFYRGDVSRARATGNSGLGLAIARGIIQAHGGTIEVSSTQGAGTEFCLALPAEAGEG